ncbi:MAG TPA: EamA family transporter RarD [Planctomycetaceae bacterium]|jgi:chloramphenicol-sensitive protein RarD|nr:EamA family transporter RarD [Planctomycetaceae bacterium]
MTGQEMGETGGGGLALGLETSDATATAPQWPRPPAEKSIAGLLFGLATYTYWGFQPLYFKLVQQVPPAAMVAHRTTWCAVLMVLLLTMLRRWNDFSRSLSKRLLFLLTLSSLMLATNWLIYIASVVSGRIVETSLGYFINPLFSVLLGVVFLRERPGRLQVGAIMLAAFGIAYLVCRLTFVPWLALGVAGTFGLYGLIRKVARVESLTGLTIETLLLTPLTGGYLLWQAMRGNDVFGGMAHKGQILVLASGVITAIPLLFFGAAARRLPLSTLGFLQFVAASLQLALAVWLYGEPFGIDHAVSFGFIWAGLVLFSADLILARRGVVPEGPLVQTR